MIATYLGLEDASFSFIPQDPSVKKREQKEKTKSEEGQIPGAEVANERFSFQPIQNEPLKDTDARNSVNKEKATKKSAAEVAIQEIYDKSLSKR